jgi:YGGT family
MTIEQVDRTVVTEAPATAGQPIVQTEHQQSTMSGPGTAETARRVIVLVFGLIQILIGARIVLLLVDARTTNGLVSLILNLSQVFVAPFEGILRTDALHAAGSILDVAAVVALVGWTVLEIVVLWAINIFRRQPV